MPLRRSLRVSQRRCIPEPPPVPLRGARSGYPRSGSAVSQRRCIPEPPPVPLRGARSGFPRTGSAVAVSGPAAFAARFRAVFVFGFVSVFVLVFASCSSSMLPSDESGTDDERTLYSIASYNTHNLFDDRENGCEYPEFLPSSPYWNTRKYLERLGRLQRVLSELRENGPDIVVLNEIEGSAVVEDLYELYLFRMGYRYSAVTADEGSPIQTAVISKYPLSGVGVLVPQVGTQVFRSVLEVTVEFPSGPLRLFACHWKSKAGGTARETEAGRRAAAGCILARRAGLDTEEAAVPVIIAGDLNSRFDESEHSEYGIETALVYLPGPDTRLPDGSIGVTGDPVVLDSGNPAVFFSPWPGWIAQRSNPAGFAFDAVPGSYRYQGDWEAIDHFLLDPCAWSGGSVRFHSFIAAAFPHLLDGDGNPAGYIVRTGTGYSDHVPILLLLEDTTEAGVEARRR